MYETWLGFRSASLSHDTKRNFEKLNYKLTLNPSHVLYILLAVVFISRHKVHSVALVF